MRRQVQENRSSRPGAGPEPAHQAVSDSVLAQLALRAVTVLGLEMVHVEHCGEGRRGKVRLLIDRPGGVSLEDCAKASEQFGALLETVDPIPSSYTLEVSSPGLDRPLFTQEDYRRFVHHLVRITTKTTLEGRRHFRGRITGCDGRDVVLQLADGADITLPLRAIARGRLEIEPGRDLQPVAGKNEDKRSQA